MQVLQRYSQPPHQIRLYTFFKAPSRSLVANCVSACVVQETYSPPSHSLNIEVSLSEEQQNAGQYSKVLSAIHQRNKTATMALAHHFLITTCRTGAVSPAVLFYKGG
ncbi:MAG TPA: hypothetical protein DCE55_29435 [Planctomycetaceae bacterium]|nr:hypothetical protein [Planctomycetaceae bacterium]